MSLAEYKIILFGSSCILFAFIFIWYVCFVLVKKKKEPVLPIVKQNESLETMSNLNQLISSVNIFTTELEETVNNIMRRTEVKEKRLLYLLKETETAIARLEKAKRVYSNQTKEEDHLVLESVAQQQVIEESAEHKLLGGRYKKVLDLHSKGISLDNIARTLSIDKGQIELICNLQKKLQ